MLANQRATFGYGAKGLPSLFSTRDARSTHPQADMSAIVRHHFTGQTGLFQKQGDFCGIWCWVDVETEHQLRFPYVWFAEERRRRQCRRFTVRAAACENSQSHHGRHQGPGAVTRVEIAGHRAIALTGLQASQEESFQFSSCAR